MLKLYRFFSCWPKNNSNRNFDYCWLKFSNTGTANNSASLKVYKDITESLVQNHKSFNKEVFNELLETWAYVWF